MLTIDPECQQPNPKPYACYASAPNDVWSLGVILVNLTCGRNPWKRAAMDDSTFRAFMRDRNSLKSILPISDELNCILQRVFEVNPQRRISLEELRDAIMRCQRLTNQGSLVPTPPYSPVEKCMESSMLNGAYDSVPQLDLPAQQYPVRNVNYQQPMMFTPPTSGQCTPQPTMYTPPSKPASSGAFFGNLSEFRRCGQILANFNMPSHHWASTF
jgi:serine/threonine protein kinase